MAYEDTTKRASEVLAVYAVKNTKRALVLVVDTVTAARLVQSGDWRARQARETAWAQASNDYFWEDALMIIQDQANGDQVMRAAGEEKGWIREQIESRHLLPIPKPTPKKVVDGIKFIRELAAEGLSDTKVGTGAEVVLRHILRKANEVLGLCK
jgi:hypothetical protein